MYLFLTGAHGAGKSRIISKAIAAADGAVIGFRTLFGADRDAITRALYMIPATGALDPAQSVIAAQFYDRYRGEVVLETFNGYGVRLLGPPDARAALRVMDECSYLERDAHAFTARVLACLDESIPVLGALTLGKAGWTDRIAAHKNVEILEMTAANAAEVEEAVLRRLRLSGS